MIWWLDGISNFQSHTKVLTSPLPGPAEGYRGLRRQWAPDKALYK